MPSPKFNNEQCEYLAHKLKVVVESAISFIEVSRAEEHGSGSSMDMARRVEVVKLLLALAREIGSFIQGCGKDAWIQSAMTLTNVSEYVSSVGFNLELCRVAFSKECAITERLTLEQVDDINKAEVKIVEMKASVDVYTLFKKVIVELNYLPSQNRDLASYLLQRLARVQPIPASFTSGTPLWSDNDDGGFFGSLFKRVQQTVRLGISASGATVDKATWLGTQVAKKTFYGPEDPEFMKEVGILARLCHPNIMSMFCSAMDRRRCSIIMELMDEDLHALMQRRLDGDSDSPPFTILESVDIMLQIGEGVNYLHNKRIEHRDLKSFNILVKSVKVGELETGYVHAKVADFGLSKIKESSTTYSNQTFNTGTNRWMAPEIINLDNVGIQESTSGSEKVQKFSFKSDVYSFAMVCCEILTGEVPFSTIRNPIIVKKKVMKGDRPDLPNHCPLNLKALIVKCWNQVPSERPSFVEICLELKHIKCLLIMGSVCSLGSVEVVDPRQQAQVSNLRPSQEPEPPEQLRPASQLGEASSTPQGRVSMPHEAAQFEASRATGHRPATVLANVGGYSTQAQETILPFSFSNNEMSHSSTSDLHPLWHAPSPSMPQHQVSATNSPPGNDPLPGIFGLRIVGDTGFGGLLTACGHSIRGTSLCMFQWVRHFQDGTAAMIEGALEPEYYYC